MTQITKAETIISSDFFYELSAIGSSHFYTDQKTIGLYATDASLYQVAPIAVFIPTTEDDLIQAVKIAHRYKVPILPRGSATSLAGQTVNRALIIDFTNHFDKIIEINAEERFAIIQPGVVRDTFNNVAKQYDLHYAPDPATSSRATIGGMIINNSSGTKSIKYGMSIDHVMSMRVLLSDGTILETNELSAEGWERKCLQDDREGQIYRDFRSVIYGHAQAIEDVFPKVKRRVQGYPLDQYIHTDRWNLAKIFSGSEGTLGIMLSAKINLEPIPKYKAAFSVHYSDRMDAIREVSRMVTFGPAAVEMLDFNVFEQSKKNHSLAPVHARLIQGDPQATLSVEFFCLTQHELDEKIEEFKSWLQGNSSAYAYPILRTAKELDEQWMLRKNGLGLLMGDPAGRKPLPFIEDMAIPLEHLADYIESVLQICSSRGVETILYAHASVGVLHVRPALDVTKQEDIDLMKEISDEVFKLVKLYKGSWSGEHGDGRDRGHRLHDFFGDEVYQCLRDVKQIFDPAGLMNPEIIIDVPPMDQNLRIDPQYKTKKYDFVYHYRDDHSFEGLVHNCSGVGVCRNHTLGTMCPSFRATSEEEDSTRGRANALRLGISGQLGFTSLTDHKVLETLDLCLSCKACKSECPSNVDMSKLKSEVLQLKYDEGKISYREKAILHNANVVKKMSGFMAPIVNRVQKLAVFRWSMEKLLGVDRRRILPDYASETLATWYKKNYKPSRRGSPIVLFADTYVNHHDTDMGKAAVQLLDSCGYEVLLANVGCCQRPRISNGFLKAAKESGTSVATSLQAYLDQGIPIVVCEPSCTTALTDDIPDLIDDIVLSQKLKKGVYGIDEFLANQQKSGKIKGQFKPKSKDILIHGHCHQKASFGTKGMHQSYAGHDDVKYYECDSGCCGMAGSFGYEVEHFDISKKIADNVLLPAIAKHSTQGMIVANGFSCRHQIHDFAGRKAVHWVQSVEWVGE
jgi:FAD/FMN-containing dehydrogenase/Fe-S oxidoreductase